MRIRLFIAFIVLAAVGVVAAQDGPDPIPIPGAETIVPSTPTLVQSPTPTVVATTETPDAATETQAVTLQPSSTPLPTLPPDFTPTPEPRLGIIDVESALVREFPASDADIVASAFRDDVLEVVGRNLDGTWFLVRRINREASLGWVFQEVLDIEFEPEFLPLEDIETGVVGDTPLESAPNLGVFIAEGVALRNLPSVELGDRLLNIPPNVVVPVLAQYNEGEWLLVNYLGTQGWIIAFTTRERDGLETLAELTGILPGDDAPTIRTFIVPPEIQLEQLERLREFTLNRGSVSTDLANFWWLVSRGEVLPCNPPPSVEAYRWSGQDVRELPEIDRYAPRLNEGVEFLNESIDVLDDCGVVLPSDVNRARADAINAGVIFNQTLPLLDNLEDNVIQ